MPAASTTRELQILTPAQDSAPRATPHSGSALTRQFAFLSLLVIGLITVALCFVISHYLRQDLLEGEWTLTAEAILAQALDYTRPADFAAPLSAPAQERFESLYRRAVLMSEVVRV